MIGLLQRVTEAAVRVDSRVVSEIGPGLLVLVAVQAEDGDGDADRLVERLIGYRVFGDQNERMNLDIRQAGGELMLVPQFTLAADTRKGTRPSFTGAAAPELGRRLFDRVVQTAARSLPDRVAAGIFGAEMKVQLINDGPVTFWLEV